MRHGAPLMGRTSRTMRVNQRKEPMFVIEMRTGPKSWKRLMMRYVSKAAAEAALPSFDEDGIVLKGMYRIRAL